MKMHSLICLTLFSIAFLSCGVNDSIPIQPEQSSELSKFGDDSNIIYFNSFESDNDTSAFFGIRPEMFIEDPAPGGGMKSLLIGGGCPQPAGSLSLKIKDEGKYKISFWAKTRDSGGIVEVQVNSDGYSYSQYVYINSRMWNKKVFDNIYFPPGSTVTLDLIVGGILYASANIDEMKVELRNCICPDKVRSGNHLKN